MKTILELLEEQRQEIEKQIGKEIMQNLHAEIDKWHFSAEILIKITPFHEGFKSDPERYGSYGAWVKTNYYSKEKAESQTTTYGLVTREQMIALLTDAATICTEAVDALENRSPIHEMKGVILP